jgi:hypothetical protein
LPTLAAPPRLFPTTCSVSGTLANSANTLMTFAQDCSGGPNWGVSVALPSKAATYALPSPAVSIDANFCVGGGDCFSNYPGPPSLQLTSGTITVKSETPSGGEASLDIEFETSAGDNISLAGPANFANCIPITTTESCSL